MLDDLWQDFRDGVRSALRARRFALLVVATLALGIGANAAVFGVVKSVLLDALPYREADRVVRVFGRRRDDPNALGPLSAGTVQDLRARGRAFERLAGFQDLPREAVFAAGGAAGPDAPRVVQVARVEPELFRTLGVGAARGRTLRDDDAAADTAAPVVLTYAAWQVLLGGDPGAVGRSVSVDGGRHPVVGVLPRDFVGPVGPLGRVDVYLPFNLRTQLADPVRARLQQNLGLVGRLRPGVTPEAAAREVAALGAALAREFPAANAGVTIAALPVRDALVGDTRTPLLVLLGSAGLVLAIACANLAGALFSRTLSRRKEFAVRAALGAGRGRLARQLLAESTVLAFAGGAAGVLLALTGLHAVRGLALTALPPTANLSLDRGALAVTALLALGTGLAVGVLPALAAGRADVQGTLREQGRGASESRRSGVLRGALVAGQVALCVSLLAGAGLLARSLWALSAAPLGFAPDDVLTASVQLPRGARYGDGAARVRFIEQAEARLRALPGVTAVATAGDLPTRVTGRNGVVAEGAPPPADGRPPLALYETVTDDYFRTLGIPLRGGRAFGPQDRADGPPVVIVSDALARRSWPAGDAVGRRLRMGPDGAPWLTVVGVVGDVADGAARLQPEPATYVPLRQAPWNGPVFLLRTAGDPAALAGPVRRALAAEAPGAALHDATPMRALLAEGLAGRRLPVALMTAFGGLALLLASVGVYAMFAAMAAAREREFGVRVALGSRPLDIAGLVLRQGGAWVAAGLAGGALGIGLVARLVRGVLFGVAPLDPVALGAAVAALLACAAVALLGPVRRAARVDPITVLR